jgi:hypothetical protein
MIHFSANPWLPVALATSVAWFSTAEAAPLITEFMASNSSTIFDEDADSSDWIEIYNPDSLAVDLGGFFLTDDAANLTKWRFPEPTLLAPSQLLLVFASDKDRAISGAQLHANFKLASDGEYLALVDPDGLTVVHDYSPSYPAQSRDVSYGLQERPGIVDDILVAEVSPCRALVPASSELGTSWTAIGYDDALWLSGTTGVGYERSNGFEDLIELDVETQMYNQNTTVYVRIPFNLTDGSEISALTLRMKYDDGFIAYLNGIRIAGDRDPASPSWNSAATAKHPDDESTSFSDFNVSDFINLFVDGRNVLAIHGLNHRTTSTDMLIRAELIGTRSAGPQFGDAGFLRTPTPGVLNGSEIELPNSEVTISEPSRTFLAPLSVTLSGAAADQKILYTLDQSLPTAASPEYLAPIRISSTTQIRARIYGTDGSAGPTSTETYIHLDADIRSFRTNLPIVIIDNFGGGRPEGKITMFMAIIQPDEEGDGVAEIGDPFEVATRGTMKVRGSSSLGWPKYSMTIEAWDGDNLDRNISPLGLPSEADWVLNSKYQFDRALMRNDLAYRMSNDLGEYAARTRHVEVVNNTGGGSLSFSDDYFGVFSLVERIKRDRNRVDVKKILATDNSEPNVSGGYLFKKDRLDPDETGFNVNGAGRLVHVYPKENDITLEQTKWLINYLNEFDAAVNASDWIHPSKGKHFTEYINVDSWLKHHWVNVLCMNVDGFRLSGFYHKDRLGKLGAGPVWDFDRSMNSADPRDDNPQAWDGTNDSSKTWDDSRFPWWGEALQNPDFKQQHTDLWQAQRDDGVFSWSYLEALIDEFNAKLNTPVANTGGVLSTAQARNFARWDLYPPRNGSHAGEVTILKNWLFARLNWIDAQFVGRPSFTVAPGPVAAGTALSFTGGGGTVFYTTDGSDPRLPGGAVSGSAKTATPVIVNDSTVITARARDGSSWSGLIQGSFLSGSLANASNLIISEVHYAPAAPPEQGSSYAPADYEFIELENISATETISLGGVHFEQGIDFAFTVNGIAALGPGERVLIVSNQAAFADRYGPALSSRIAGEFANGTHLDNDGETIQLVDGLGADIALFTYDDQAPWPFDAGFTGYSLVLITDGTAPPADYDDPGQWRMSVDLGGNPNASDSESLVGRELDDLDHDGLSALLEHALGTSDTEGGSGLDAVRVTVGELEVAGVTDLYLIATHRRRLAADGTVILVEIAESLDGTWTTAGLVPHSEIHNGDGTSRVTYRSESPVSSANAPVFARVAVQTR